MKNLAIGRDEQLQEACREWDMREAHYYMLVNNVAQWIVEEKSTRILTDVEHAVHKLYINGHYSKKKGNNSQTQSRTLNGVKE